MEVVSRFVCMCGSRSLAFQRVTNKSMTAGLYVTAQAGAWQKTPTSHLDLRLLLLPPASL